MEFLFGRGKIHMILKFDACLVLKVKPLTPSIQVYFAIYVASKHPAGVYHLN